MALCIRLSLPLTHVQGRKANSRPPTVCLFCTLAITGNTIAITIQTGVACGEAGFSLVTGEVIATGADVGTGCASRGATCVTRCIAPRAGRQATLWHGSVVERHPLPTLQNINLHDGVNFPQCATRLSKLLRMFGIEHQPPTDTYFCS